MCQKKENEDFNSFGGVQLFLDNSPHILVTPLWLSALHNIIRHAEEVYVYDVHFQGMYHMTNSAQGGGKIGHALRYCF